MRKKLYLILILFAMVLGLILNYGQPIKYISDNDGVIEWHNFSEENLT